MDATHTKGTHALVSRLGTQPDLAQQGKCNAPVLLFEVLIADERRIADNDIKAGAAYLRVTQHEKVLLRKPFSGVSEEIADADRIVGKRYGSIAQAFSRLGRLRLVQFHTV
jgi:hypothetical protein